MEGRANRIRLTFLSVIALALPAFARKIDCGRASGTVSFEAVGRPSMLTIRGKSEKGLHGALSLVGQNVSGTCSFDLETLTTGMSLRDDHMKHKYLQTQTFPQAALTLTKLRLPSPLSGDKIPFEGELRLHGEKRKVRGTASLAPSSGKERVELRFELSLPEFGISQPSFSGITVGKSVTVEIAIVAPLSE